MTIEELGDLMQCDLILTRYAAQNNRWCCQFEHAEVKEGCGLLGTHGNAKTPYGAIADYVKKIRGRVIVINAMGDNRREFGVPSTLTCQGGE